MKCKKCGNNKFYAHQLCRMDVIVDENGEFEDNVHPEAMGQDIYDSGKPYGPFTCTKCGWEYEKDEER